MPELTHFDESGAARMVDVGLKPESERTARASGLVRMAATTLAKIRSGSVGKGDVLGVARLAGILSAKQTGTLIPLCHPLPLSAVMLDFGFPDDATLSIEATAKVIGRTGVEMEALTAVSVAALTVIDMVKSLDRGVFIERIRLEEKTGGRSGHFQRID